MLAYEPCLEPDCDYLHDYKIPERIKEMCKDILKYGSATSYAHVYEALYELAEEDILTEKEEAYVY